MAILGLVRNCPICNKPVRGLPYIHNTMHYHGTCFHNRLVQREYYNELSNREELLANLYYLELL